MQTYDLIGKPFAYHARGPESFDCWGLVRECYFRWHGVELPDYPSTRSPRANDVEISGALKEKRWQRVERPFPGAIALMRVRNFGSHVGFVTSPTRMIHTLQGMGVTSVKTSTFKNQIIGAYVYVE